MGKVTYSERKEEFTVLVLLSVGVFRNIIHFLLLSFIITIAIMKRFIVNIILYNFFFYGCHTISIVIMLTRFYHC